jgi:uncharacterized OB-fold protein
MSPAVLRQPALFTGPDGEDAPKLRALRCACGFITYPPQRYGCESCGRDGSLAVELELDGRGVLTAVAWVHVHPSLPTPFALGRILLDAGLAVEAWLTGNEGDLAVGRRVRAVLVSGAKTDTGAPILDCRFAPEDP